MRRIFLSLFVAFVAFATTFAQGESEHLTFKGVPIDGTLDEYVAKMKQAGFTYLTTYNGTAVLEGNFAGYKGCKIIVIAHTSNSKVYGVGVMFPEHESWTALETDYDNLKLMLMQKYGEPSECVENFHGHITPETNNDKLHELKMDNCTWKTTYETSKGSICVSLSHAGLTSCYVMLCYIDQLNSLAMMENAIDDL